MSTERESGVGSQEPWDMTEDVPIIYNVAEFIARLGTPAPRLGEPRENLLATEPPGPSRWQAPGEFARDLKKHRERLAKMQRSARRQRRSATPTCTSSPRTRRERRRQADQEEEEIRFNRSENGAAQPRERRGTAERARPVPKKVRFAGGRDSPETPTARSTEPAPSRSRSLTRQAYLYKRQTKQEKEPRSYRIRRRNACWNCGDPTHFYAECPVPDSKAYCPGCGRRDRTLESCRSCQGRRPQRSGPQLQEDRRTRVREEREQRREVAREGDRWQARREALRERQRRRRRRARGELPEERR